MNNIQVVDINDIDLNNSHFHFTLRSNLEEIDKSGLKARVGDASKMVGENDARVYLSKGGKGLLKTKDTFINKFLNVRICDITEDYRKYFDFTDYTSTDVASAQDVYSAMEKRLKDEVYLRVNAVEGEDYLEEDVNALWGMVHDIKGKQNHDIGLEKLSLISTDKEDSAFEVVQYFYNRMLERNPGKEDIIRDMFPTLSAMLEYIRQRDSLNIENNQSIEGGQKSTQDLGRETLPQLKDTALLDEIQAATEVQMEQQKETNEQSI